jgi:C4-dicarboxylate transporter, DctM subunit
MSPELIGLIGVIVLFALMILRMWVAACMAIVGFFGVVILRGWEQAFAAITQTPFLFIADYNFSVAPMFMLMGTIVSEMGIGADLFYTVNKWLGQMRGGLAVATTGASALFAAIVGDSLSGVIVFSKTALPEMRKFIYSDFLSSGTIAVGATMGILIPPSMGFVLYGIMTEQSVGKLFMAGILPGILQAVTYMIVIYTWCRIKPSVGPAGPKIPFKEKVSSLSKIWATVVLVLLVMGGIYGGFFTATEGGAVGALGAIIITIAMGRFTLKGSINVLRETGLLTGMFILIMVGVPLFKRFVTVSQITVWIGDAIVNSHASPVMVIIIIVLMWLVLGCFMNSTMALVLTLPIIYPMVVAMGFNPIWFGVISVRLVEIGNITPPYGMNAFMLAGLTGIPTWTVYKGVIPFLIADLVDVVLLLTIPAISLFLPNSMGR